MGVHQQQPAALGGARMAKTAIGLQDLYLNQIRKEHIPVIIYLINGVQLRGLVRAFDNFTVLDRKSTRLNSSHT